MAKFIEFIYWYCTDFFINMANLLGITYVEFNIWLFLIILPGILLLLFLLNLPRYLIRPVFKKITREK